jgi:cell division protein ZapA (FtsZ GTPase activity inhibitor)
LSSHGSKPQTSGAGPASLESSRSSRVQIAVGGTTVSLRSDRDDAFVEGLAAYVNDKVESIQQVAAKVTPEKQLILASLMIAEDYFVLRERLDTLEAKVTLQVSRCKDVVDKLEEDADG